MAGGLADQVLGVAVGGALAAAHGWRMAFLAIGIGGLVLAITYPWLVRESRLSDERNGEHQMARPSFRAVFAGRGLKCAYVGSGCNCSLLEHCQPGCLPISVRDYGISLPFLAIAWAAATLALLVPGMLQWFRSLLFLLSTFAALTLVILGLLRSARGPRSRPCASPENR